MLDAGRLCYSSHFSLSSGIWPRLAPPWAALQRESEKTPKYSELAVMESASFILLILETTGAIGNGFRQFIHRISSRVHDAGRDG